MEIKFLPNTFQKHYQGHHPLLYFILALTNVLYVIFFAVCTIFFWLYLYWIFFYFKSHLVIFNLFLALSSGITHTVGLRESYILLGTESSNCLKVFAVVDRVVETCLLNVQTQEFIKKIMYILGIFCTLFYNHFRGYNECATFKVAEPILSFN